MKLFGGYLIRLLGGRQLLDLLLPSDKPSPAEITVPDSPEIEAGEYDCDHSELVE